MLEEYRRQQSFRNWEGLLSRIKEVEGSTAVELGSATGFVCNLLARRFKKVIGLELNPELLSFARSENPICEFFQSDFESFDYEAIAPISLVFSSFSWSYVKEPVQLLKKLKNQLADNGKIAILEIDRMFSRHLPDNHPFYDRIFEFESISAGSQKYSFLRGSELLDQFQEAGFLIDFKDDDVRDPELNFSGAAAPEVMENWKLRLERMTGLRDFLGDSEYKTFAELFLEVLSEPSHVCTGAVKMAMGSKDES